jgi:geranylgeranyl pyrophosphate synthase
MYAYGKHLGLAFQVVDDVSASSWGVAMLTNVTLLLHVVTQILDFTQSAEQLGKPQVGGA